MLNEAARLPQARDRVLERDMAEMLAHMTGQVAKLTRFKTTQYDLPIEPVEVKALRQSLALSQNTFADLVNVSVRLVQGWEQGMRRPDGSTSLLLWLVKEHPEVRHWLEQRKRTGRGNSNSGSRLGVGGGPE